MIAELNIIRPTKEMKWAIWEAFFKEVCILFDSPYREMVKDAYITPSLLVILANELFNFYLKNPQHDGLSARINGETVKFTRFVFNDSICVIEVTHNGITVDVPYNICKDEFPNWVYRKRQDGCDHSYVNIRVSGFQPVCVSVCEKCYHREDDPLLDQTEVDPEPFCKPIEVSHRSDRLSKHTDVVDTTSKSCSAFTKIAYFLTGVLLTWVIVANITVRSC